MPKPTPPNKEPEIEWRDPPPKAGRTKQRVDPDQISAGMKIRRQIEQDRRRRGIPKEGILLPGDEIARPADGEEYRHGTYMTYATHGCRCDTCSAFMRGEKARLYQQKVKAHT